MQTAHNYIVTNYNKDIENNILMTNAITFVNEHIDSFVDIDSTHKENMKNYTRDIISTIMSIIITGTTLPAVLMFCIPYFVYSFSHYLKRISLLALNSTLSGRLADRIDIEIWGGKFSVNLLYCRIKEIALQD